MPIVHESDVLGQRPSANGRILPTLEVIDLSFAYPDGHEALRAVSFSIGVGKK